VIKEQRISRSYTPRQNDSDHNAFRQAVGLGSHSQSSALQQSLNITAAAHGREEVAEVAATRKCQKYSELSTAYLSLPIAVETLGPMNDLASVCFEMLSCKITGLSGDSQEVLSFY